MGKTKGSAVLAAVKLLRRQKDRAHSLLPTSLHHYLEERIVVASWYAEEDAFELIRVCASLLPVERGRVFEMMGEYGARAHLEGIYAGLLGRGAAARARTLWKTQHDTGVLSVRSETPSSVTYELTGWDHASREYCRLLGGYFAEVHRLGGAASPRFEHPSCRKADANCCVWVIRWEESG